MKKEKTYWWFIRTEICFQSNVWHDSQTLTFEAIDEHGARYAMLSAKEELPECWRMAGDLEGPYETREQALYFAKIHKTLGHESRAV